MDHDLELISPILEILEISVFPYFWTPGNIGNLIFLYFLDAWKYWKMDFFDSVLSWKYWKFDFSNFPISWKYWKYIFLYFFRFFQKRRAPKFHAGCTDG